MRRVLRSAVLVVPLILVGLVMGGLSVSPAAAQVATAAPSLVDAKSAVDTAAASTIAVKFGHAVVDQSLTTETSQVSAMPDGTMQLEESSVPVRVKRGGSWSALDENLVAGDDGRVAPKAAAVAVEFAGGGSDEMTRVQTPSGEWVTESWPYGNLVTSLVVV